MQFYFFGVGYTYRSRPRLLDQIPVGYQYYNARVQATLRCTDTLG